MKLKTFSALTGIAGLIALFASAVMPFVYMKEVLHGGIDIVGGADGPTYRYIIEGRMGGWPVFFMLAGIALVLTALFCLIFSNTVRKHCRIPTTLLALGMSASGMLGLASLLEWAAMFAFGDFHKYPIRHPVCVITGMLCACLLTWLAVLYYRVRRKHWSGVGFALDIVTGVLYLPGFLWFIGCVDRLLS